ncbi:MAG: hypothetical protein RIR26_1607 [Pseudomonadota bacterium]
MQIAKELPKSHNKTAVVKADPHTMQDRLEAWCRGQQLDAVLITAQDAFLSEYTPLASNQRFHLSSFSGSTGDGIFLTRTLADRMGQKAQFQLFVDGRYHLQADQETSPELVAVHKLQLSTGIDEALLSWMRSSFPAGTHLGLDAQRVGWLRWTGVLAWAEQEKIKVTGFELGEINAALQLQGWKTDRPIETLPESVTGRSLSKNLAALRAFLKEKSAGKNYVYALCSSDDVAWLLNARAYHMPQLSSLLGYAFVTPELCVLHLPEESKDCPYVSDDASEVTVTRGSLDEAFKTLKRLNEMNGNGGIEKIYFSARAMNAALPRALQRLFPASECDGSAHLVEVMRVAKTPEELHSVRQSFLRSSRAIAKTLRWAKECAKQDQPLSETDLAQRIATEYLQEGALELSFKTISGFAENGAVIHYSQPNPEKKAAQGDLLLLDSGAYYKEGFATDCTRVALFAKGSSSAQPWQKEIYTLTLKACLAGLRATFALSTPCRDVDALARSPLQSKGYDYAHGTGHGIGIHVHENGIRLSPASQYTFTENALVSVEPGVYLAGKGGVRIENVAIVVPRADGSAETNTHTFENVVYVGYDWDLIDVELLSPEDKNDLIAYERKCQSLGTAVTACPLVG